MTEPGGLARVIDHTILRPDAGRADVIRFCDEAKLHHFCSVCVNPVNIPTVARALAGSGVRTCSVIGFPFGAIPTAVKAAEASWVVEAGADEVDMVIALGALKDGDLPAVRKDITDVKRACGKAILKVILETCLLTEDEKIAACRLSQEAGADFVKTSTGYSKAGATVEDIALMRRIVGDAMGVKASGGIRTRADAIRMLEAGASRIGASASIAIIGG
ncbi:deoxyribose-phosphate aldolase [Telmatospirillum sp.]|uniref:deoxyribose-phosphate aldolase n=1 Tax=Telmatospirillum sp. TaxID=2079197 RepID=UPI00386A6F07